jgi:hypothetical protein
MPPVIYHRGNPWLQAFAEAAQGFATEARRVKQIDEAQEAQSAQQMANAVTGAVEQVSAAFATNALADQGLDRQMAMEAFRQEAIGGRQERVLAAGTEATSQRDINAMMLEQTGMTPEQFARDAAGGFAPAAPSAAQPSPSVMAPPPELAGPPAPPAAGPAAAAPSGAPQAPPPEPIVPQLQYVQGYTRKQQKRRAQLVHALDAVDQTFADPAEQVQATETIAAELAKIRKGPIPAGNRTPTAAEVVKGGYGGVSMPVNGRNTDQMLYLDSTTGEAELRTFKYLDDGKTGVDRFKGLEPEALEAAKLQEINEQYQLFNGEWLRREKDGEWVAADDDSKADMSLFWKTRESMKKVSKDPKTDETVTVYPPDEEVWKKAQGFLGAIAGPEPPTPAGPPGWTPPPEETVRRLSHDIANFAAEMERDFAHTDESLDQAIGQIQNVYDTVVKLYPKGAPVPASIVRNVAKLRHAQKRLEQERAAVAAEEERERVRRGSLAPDMPVTTTSPLAP